MLYLARRWLHYDPRDWLALPWWVQDVLLEGMAEEVQQRSGDGEGGATYEEQVDVDNLDDLAATGFDVESVEIPESSVPPDAIRS